MELAQDLAERGKVDITEAFIGGTFVQAKNSDGLDDKLLEDRQFELIAPHKQNRKRPPTQEGRKLRRYRRRWKVERLFAWMQNFRRLAVRYEYHVDNFLAWFN